MVQFAPLSRVLAGVTLAAPLSLPPLMVHVGLLPLVDWMGESDNFVWFKHLYRFLYKIKIRFVGNF